MPQDKKYAWTLMFLNCVCVIQVTLGTTEKRCVLAFYFVLIWMSEKRKPLSLSIMSCFKNKTALSMCYVSLHGLHRTINENYNKNYKCKYKFVLLSQGTTNTKKI